MNITLYWFHLLSSVDKTFSVNIHKTRIDLRICVSRILLWGWWAELRVSLWSQKGLVLLSDFRVSDENIQKSGISMNKSMDAIQVAPVSCWKTLSYGWFAVSKAGENSNLFYPQVVLSIVTGWCRNHSVSSAAATSCNRDFDGVGWYSLVFWYSIVFNGIIRRRYQLREVG